jgi:hypothetical protein
VELLHERCAALDIGKKDLKACVRTPSPSGRQSRRQEVRTFGTTIAGVGPATAEVIIAETGADMTRFRTAGHLASWAGVCPGHQKKAIVALEYSILTAVWHMLTHDTDYHDLRHASQSRCRHAAQRRTLDVSIPEQPARSSPLTTLATLLADERGQQGDDLLLSGGGAVELAAHLGKAVVDLGKAGLELLPEVEEVLAHRVKHPRVLLPELPDLSANLGDVAVGSARQHAGGGRVLLAVAHPFGQLTDVRLQRGHADLQVGLLSHAGQRSGLLPGVRSRGCRCW